MTIANLERALPGLAQCRRTLPMAPDWGATQDALGFIFPADYMELVEKYPGFVICDFLSIYRPSPGHESAFVLSLLDELVILQENYADGASPYPPHPEADGLLPWGGSTSGDTYYWAVTNGTAAAVVTGSGSDIYWRFDGDLTDFIAGWVTGELQPDDQPTAEQLGGISFRFLS